jgi:hypothetical protein
MPATDPIGIDRLEALLAGDAPRTPAEERRASLVADLRGRAPSAPEALREHVLRPAPAPRRSPRLGLPSRRRALVLVPAVLALALRAAALHGVGSPAPRAAVPAPAASLKAAPAAGVAPLKRAGDSGLPGRERSRSARMLDSALVVLRIEGAVALAALALAALAAALATARRRREERRLLGASPGRRDDLME